MDAKMIRFIDTRCRELLAVPDGGSITVTHENGEQYVGICEYLDGTHFKINGDIYHQSQFAEKLERSSAKIEIEKEPEIVGISYRIIYRIPVFDKIYVLGHSPKAPQPYATWQAYRNYEGKDWGHYYSGLSDAMYDLHRRAEAERTGIPYDHTKPYKDKNRNDAR